MSTVLTKEDLKKILGEQFGEFRKEFFGVKKKSIEIGEKIDKIGEKLDEIAEKTNETSDYLKILLEETTRKTFVKKREE